MTDRDPAQRPTCAQVATDLRAITAGGQATTVIAAPTPVAERTQVLDRTQLLTTAVPGGRTAEQPVRRQVTPVLPPPRRNNWAIVVGLLLAIGILVVAGLLIGRSGSSTAVPDPIKVRQDLKPPLRQHLQQLQDEVKKTVAK